MTTILIDHIVLDDKRVARAMPAANGRGAHATKQVGWAYPPAVARAIEARPKMVGGCAHLTLLFTQDEDLLAESAARQSRGQSFAGVLYAHLLQVAIGSCIDALELIAGVYEPQEMADQLLYLPLK